MDTVTSEVVRVTLDPCVDTRLISNAFGIRITQMGRANGRIRTVEISDYESGVYASNFAALALTGLEPATSLKEAALPT